MEYYCLLERYMVELKSNRHNAEEELVIRFEYQLMLEVVAQHNTQVTLKYFEQRFPYQWTCRSVRLVATSRDIVSRLH